MINLLLVDVIEKGYNSKMVKDTIEKVKPDTVELIVCIRSELPLYTGFGRCYLREDVARGEYSDDDYAESLKYPLEDEVFEYMAPHVTEIFLQQKRFQQRFDFHIDDSFDTQYDVYMHNLAFWYGKLKAGGITHVFFTDIPHEGYGSIIYHLCKFLKIPVIMSFEGLIPGYKYILDDYETAHIEIGKKYEKIKEEYKDKKIEEIELHGRALSVYEQWTSLDESKMVPIYMRGDRLRQTFESRYGLTNVLKAWYRQIKRYELKYGRGIKLCCVLVRNIPYFIRITGQTYKQWRYARPYWKETVAMRKYYDDISEYPVSGEKYIYFALHYQPEATSNPLGKEAYVDQRVPIQILNASIPDDYKIYVKMHPDQLAFFAGKSYFHDISLLDKVRLIKADYSTFSLMKNAVAVASIAGTACWECQFWGKPALLFGLTYKNVTPLAFPVRTVKECKAAMDKIINNPPKTDNKELKLFVKLMQEISFDMSDIGEYYPKMIYDLVYSK